MLNYSWNALLSQWSKQLIASESSKHYDLLPDVITSGWLGYRGATDEQIVAAETRLGTALPASYREFLKITNGWRTTGNCCVDKFWSAEALDWHYARHASTVDMWVKGEQRSGGPMPDEAYFVYGDAQPNAIRAQYLKAALEISDVAEGSVYLLNPLVINSDGEWEAWFFADWLPGAERHRSFWELMQHEYRKFRRKEEHLARRFKPEDMASLSSKMAGLVQELSGELQGWLN